MIVCLFVYLSSIAGSTARPIAAKHGVKVEFEILKEADGKTVARGWFDYTLVCVGKGRPQVIPEDVVAIYSI